MALFVCCVGLVGWMGLLDAPDWMDDANLYFFLAMFRCAGGLHVETTAWERWNAEQEGKKGSVR